MINNDDLLIIMVITEKYRYLMKNNDNVRNLKIYGRKGIIDENNYDLCKTTVNKVYIPIP